MERLAKQLLLFQFKVFPTHAESPRGQALEWVPGPILTLVTVLACHKVDCQGALCDHPS
jgi:hypothetical protein